MYCSINNTKLATTHALKSKFINFITFCASEEFHKAEIQS